MSLIHKIIEDFWESQKKGKRLNVLDLLEDHSSLELDMV